MVSYEPHEWDTGEVITAARLNAIEQGIAGAGAGYDVVVETAMSQPGNNLANFSATWSDYQAAKAKVLAGEPVTGILKYHYNYDELVDGDTSVGTVPLVEIHIYSDSAQMTFASLLPQTSSSSSQMTVWAIRLTFGLNLNTGALSSISNYIWKQIGLS